MFIENKLKKNKAYQNVLKYNFEQFYFNNISDHNLMLN